MIKVLLLILLITVVYSWDECKYVAKVLWAKIWKSVRPDHPGGQKINQHSDSETDILVSDIVLIATIPLTLAYLILGTQDLVWKLVFVLGEFLLIGLILRGLEEYKRRRKFTAHYQGSDKVIAMVFSLLGLVSPSMRFASGIVRSTTHVGKYLVALAIPLVLGLALTVASRKLGQAEFNSQIDVLIVVAILGLVLNITIEALEKMFRLYKFKLSSLFRILLGIAIISTVVYL